MPTVESSETKLRWMNGRLVAIGEFALVAVVFVADGYGLIPLSKTPFLLALGWLSLRMRGLHWRDVGLERFRSWPMTLVVGVAVGVGMELLDLLVTKPMQVRFLGGPPDISAFRPMVGNLKLALLGWAATWTLAAFGEELVWRGYLLNRVAGLFRNTPAGWVVSLILVSAVFGASHGYQGAVGMIQEGFAGLLLGVVYLACGRNLAVPIVAHGITDSIDVLLVFTGLYPGLPKH
jgi:membrane protease YdiL (CAAX protease family)